MYNKEPIQKIGDTYYMYGTPLNPDKPTNVEFPDGKTWAVISANEQEVKYAPVMNNKYGYNRNLVTKTTIDKIGDEYSPFVAKNYKKPEEPSIVGMSGPAVTRGTDGYYEVYGQRVDLNDENTTVRFPNGQTYNIKEIEDGKITYAPRTTGTLAGIWDTTYDEQTRTLSIEDFEKVYYPINKDSNGRVTVFGEPAKVGAVVKDPNGNAYVIESINGDDVRLKEAELDGNRIKKVGNSYDFPSYDNRNKQVEDDPAWSPVNNPTRTSDDNPTISTPDDPTKTPPDDPTRTPVIDPTRTSDDDPTISTPDDPTRTPDYDPTKTSPDDPTKTSPDDPTAKANGDTDESTETEIQNDAEEETNSDGTAKIGVTTDNSSEESKDDTNADKTAEDNKETENDAITIIAKDSEDEAVADGDPDKEDIEAAIKEEAKNSLPEVNDEYTSRADGYKEVKKLSDDYYHGYGTKDVGNVGDQDKAIKDFDVKFYDDKVQKKFEEINNGPTIHAGEGISHHHHQTMVDNIDYKGQHSDYLPGDLIKLADSPKNLSDVTPFREMYEENMDKNIIGKTPESGEAWSRIDYIAAFASSGKYSAQDLAATATALGNDNFVKYRGPYFQNTKFAETVDLIKNEKKATEMQQELEDDVNDLIDGWKEIHEILDGMSGAAKDAHELYTVQCIQGKFEVAMGNINERLKPACVAITLLYTTSNLSNISGIDGVKLPPNKPDSIDFVPTMDKDAPYLEQLKLGEEELNTYIKKDVANAKDPNLEQLEKDIEDAKSALSRLETKYRNHYGSKPKPVVDLEGNEVPGTNLDRLDWWNSELARITSDKAAASAKLEELNEKYKELTDLVEKYTDQLNAVFEYSLILFDFVEKYSTYRQTFRKYVRGGDYSDGVNIYGIIMDRDINQLVRNHDAIIHGFEDFDKMPQISNKTDYEVGDVVLYDDAHGYIYVVEGYDSLTGQLKIACYDRDGNKVGSDIVVWDQREIAPIRGIRDIPDWHEYDDIPDKFTEPEKVKDTTPKKDHIPGTNPGTNPGTIPETIPKTAPNTIPNTIPKTIPKTIPEVIPTPPPINVVTIPDQNPDIPTPPTNPKPKDPTSPHTGLDAIYGSGETKQSAVGLGALAGLAAGAAGLGLTGLIGDKEEEEDEEDDSSLQEIEEEKKDVKEDTEEQQEEDKKEETSNPQFF